MSDKKSYRISKKMILKEKASQLRYDSPTIKRLEINENNLVFHQSCGKYTDQFHIFYEYLNNLLTIHKLGKRWIKIF